MRRRYRRADPGHGAVTPKDPEQRIAFLKQTTAAALAGQPTGLAAFDAFGLVASECAIPASLASDHLSGFGRDATGWRPANQEELLSYCYQVAGAVGVMMAHVMGVDPADRDTLDRAADLGIAFQLANIARDVVDDAMVGRIYLPADWRADQGLEHADLADPAHRPALARITQRLATLAELYRRRARLAPAALPFRSRWAVRRRPELRRGANRRRDSRPARMGPPPSNISKAEKFALVIEAFGEALWPAPKKTSARGCGPAPWRAHPGKPIRRKRRLQPLDRRCVNKSEADSAFPGFDRMVDPVRLNDPLEIMRARHDPVSDAAVDDDVVEAEINRAVGCDAGADPRRPGAPAALNPAVDQHDRGNSENNTIEIVKLEPAHARLVMAGVEKPADPPMHHPAVHDVGEALHEGDRQDEQDNTGDRGHVSHIARGSRE